MKGFEAMGISECVLDTGIKVVWLRLRANLFVILRGPWMPGKNRESIRNSCLG